MRIYKIANESLYEKLSNDNKIPLTFDYNYDDVIGKTPVCVFTSIRDDTETMGGLSVDTRHSLGYDKNGNFFHWIKESYEDGDETDWYEI